jgi:hypothetical protein
MSAMLEILGRGAAGALLTVEGTLNHHEAALCGLGRKRKKNPTTCMVQVGETPPFNHSPLVSGDL